jgi:selenium-binding protein 1
MDNAACCANKKGPGYKSPQDAMKAEREKLLYTVLVAAGTTNSEPDCLATIDADSESPTNSKIIHLLKMKYVGDELHHFGWNACSSCCDDSTKERRFLVLLGFKSSRIYIVDIKTYPRAPFIHKIIEPEQLFKSGINLSAPHTTHCLANGNIMISCLGDRDGNAPGGFLLLNSEFEVIGRWGEGEKLDFSYDFWYQPYHNVMVSSEWSAPNTFQPGFDPAHVAQNKYGNKLYFWDWSNGKIVQTIELGEDGKIPLECRFHHNPKSTHGYVGVALSSSVFHWYKDEAENQWKAEKVIQCEPVEVDGWPFPVPSLITDILISMDDRFIYFSNWFHGDVRQYDISDPHMPKLVGQIWLGGLVNRSNPELLSKWDKKFLGGPQMLQLSLDGKRLYVTNSLFSSWDDQFYPDLAKNGSTMLRINCDTEKGGLSLDESFFVDFIFEFFFIFSKVFFRIKIMFSQ